MARLRMDMGYCWAPPPEPGSGHCRPSRSGRGRAPGGLLAAVLATGLGLCGCQQPEPAVLSNQLLVEGELDPRRVLSASDEAEIHAAFRSVAEGRTAVDPPAPAPGGLRWSDVPAAVGAACDEKGIEMVVVKERKEDDGRLYRFELRTIEDWPGELVVRRVDGPDLYEAEAWIGRFPEKPARIHRAEKLLAEIDKQMRRLGRQKWFNEEETSKSQNVEKSKPKAES